MRDKQTKILVVDDDKKIRSMLALALERKGYPVQVAENGIIALSKLMQNTYDIVVLDQEMPEMSGRELLEELKERNIRVCVLMLTAYDSIELDVATFELGAKLFLKKSPTMFEELPKKVAEIEREIEEEVDSIEFLECDQLAKYSYNYASGALVGKSEPMRRIFRTLKKIALSNGPVLLEGETGTGKELLAGAIHYHSERSNDPFVAVNCAAIPESLVESELFGHAKGAFTSAERSKIGKFKLADKGTLFLDEIGDMKLDAQAKLLRAIQFGEFSPVGKAESEKVDVRIITATGYELGERVNRGMFREDLYHRISSHVVKIPPLRERAEDIDILLAHFIMDLNEKLNKKISRISNNAREILRDYKWPGNVRELRRVLEGAVLHTTGETLMSMSIKESLRYFPPLEEKESACLQTFFLMKHAEATQAFEKEYFKKLLEKAGGSVTKAAKLAGTYPSNVSKKKKKYQL